MTSARAGAGSDAIVETHLVVSQLNMAVWVQRALHVAVSLDLFEHLAAGPVDLPDLAQAAGAHPSSLRRVLRLLAAQGFVEPVGPDRFGLTAMGGAMLEGSAMSARWLVMDNAVYAAAAAVEHSVRTGEAAFPSVHGMGFWPYLADNPAAALAFTQKMHAQALTLSLPTALACAWRDGETVVDVGGGDGTLLGGILVAHPALHGVAVDQGESSARTADRLEALGVATRCEVRSADFFADAVPFGDTLLLSRVLHDWDDDAAHDLLCRLRSRVLPGGRLIVLEMLLPEDDSPHPALLGDLNLLVLFGGARERTRAEFASLFASAGFEPVEDVRTGSPVVAMIAQPR